MANIKPKVQPRLRKEYKPCDPFWIRKEFKWLLEKKGITKNQQEDFFRGLISSCAKGAVKGATESARMPRKKRQMSWYNCCIKKCSEEKGFGECLQSGVCKKVNVTEKDKIKYDKMAKEGCA